MNMNIAIITGASSGMGKEFAIQIAKTGKIDAIWAIARRKERLVKLQQEVSIPVRIFDYDITKEENVEKLVATMKEEKPIIRILINASGFGKIGNFEDSNKQDQLGMITLNCSSLISITHACLPYMRKGSRIIQLASAAAFLPQPKFAIYAASKSFVLSFSRGLNAELKDRGIAITSVCPGPVKTEFFDVASPTGDIAGFKKYFMADPVKVVEKALADSMKKKEMSVYGIRMQLLQGAAKILPHKIFLKIMVHL